MLDKKTIALIGYSGHSYVVLEAAQLMGLIPSGYCEKQKASSNPYGLEYLGFEGDENFDWSTVDKVILGIGENALRKRIAKLLESRNKELVNIVHPKAITSTTIKLGNGNFIGANTIINAQAKIGNYVILNTGCIVEHECSIGNAVHIAPGAVLAGNVEIGNESFVGANAVIKQNVSIGANVVIGAGSTVVNDVPDNQIWVGNPAKLLKK